MLGVSTIMVMRDQLMLQYISDLEKSGIKNIEIDEGLKRVGGTPDSGDIKPFDLNQIWCNIPFQSLSNAYAIFSATESEVTSLFMRKFAGNDTNGIALALKNPYRLW